MAERRRVIAGSAALDTSIFLDVSLAMTRTALRSRTVSAISVADAFQALSDDTRLAVLEMLRDGERCVCDLQAALDAAQSRLSFHLKVLKDAGLVTDRKEGRWSYYALNTERFAELEAVMGGFVRAPAVRSAATLHSLTRARRRPTASVRASATSEPRRSNGNNEKGCC